MAISWGNYSNPNLYYSEANKKSNPGEDINKELYSIWYEHAQSAAVACFEYLDENFPEESKEVSKKFDKLFK